MTHFWDSPLFRRSMAVLGGILLLVAPLVGVLPGPGGVFVVAAGLTLILRYSVWARRLYVKLSRRWPRHGARADWALRRKSRGKLRQGAGSAS